MKKDKVRKKNKAREVGILSPNIMPLDPYTGPAVPAAEVHIIINDIDPRAMDCDYTMQVLPNGSVLPHAPFPVGGNYQTFLDLDLTNMGINKGQYVRVVLEIADDDATFIPEQELSVTAGNAAAHLIMYRPTGGTYVSDTEAMFYCKYTGGVTNLLPYNVGMWLYNSDAGANYKMQVSFDPKIKNNG
jgi:hypothetical protein